MDCQIVFQNILRAVISGNKTLFEETVARATNNNYTDEDLLEIIRRVDFWCRTRGLKPLLPAERQAVLKIQSVFRRWHTRRKLLKRYELFTRLSHTDFHEYATVAQKYHTLLHRISNV